MSQPAIKITNLNKNFRDKKPSHLVIAAAAALPLVGIFVVMFMVLLKLNNTAAFTTPIQIIKESVSSKTVDTTACPIFDVNTDNRVDVLDVHTVGAHKTPQKYNPLYDVNLDGIVNNRDEDLVAKHFGDPC